MTAEIITGPWKQTESTIDEVEKAKLKSVCDQITSDCTVSILEHLVENDMAPEDPDDESITYVMFLTELVRAITYRSINVKHSFQDIVTLLSGVQIEIDNSKHFYIDDDAVLDVINFLKERNNTPEGSLA